LSLSDLNDFAEHLISPSLSTLEGVAQVDIFGQRRYAVRVRVLPAALAARNISLDELTAAISAANSNTPVGTLDGPQQTLTLQANRQLRNAAEFASIIVSTRDGQPGAVARCGPGRRQFRDGQDFGHLQWRTLDHAGLRRQPNANTVKVVDEVRSALRVSRRSCRAPVKISLLNDRSVSVRDSLHDVNLTLMGTVVLVVPGDLLVLAPLRRDMIPTLSLPVLAGRRGGLAVGAGLQPRQHLAARPDAGGRPGRRRRDRDAREHHASRGRGRAAVSAALRGSREVGFTILSISSSLVAVFIPIFFMRV